MRTRAGGKPRAAPERPLIDRYPSLLDPSLRGGPALAAPTPPELRPFLSDLRLSTLGGLLESHPELLWHPLVKGQLFHLRNAPGPLFRADGQELSPEALLALLNAWLRGFLRGGWALKPTRPPGRPRTEAHEREFAASLLIEYETTLTILRREKHQRRLRGESVSAWKTRLGRLVRHAQREARFYLELDSETGELRPFPVPDAVVEEWVEGACREGGQVRANLARRFVAYRNNVQPHEAENAIRYARKHNLVAMFDP